MSRFAKTAVMYVLLTGSVGVWAQEAQPGISATAIGAQPLATALEALGQQTGLQIVYVTAVVEGKLSQGAPAGLGAKETLEKVLEGTGLTYKFLTQKTVSIQVQGRVANVRGEEQGSGIRLVQAGTAASAEEEGRGEEGEQGIPRNEPLTKETELESGIPEILVTGSKMRSLNMDIKRTQDDTQPYVVFDRESIERSSAVNLEEFFKNHLTMGVSAVSGFQEATSLGNVSKLNLRGLGSDETLILVDGRRVAGLSAGLFGGGQPDLNGIPLSAIERVEVLPTTASGIYGGGATGGVVNIVLRRDYYGLSTKLTYGNTFDSDAATRRFDLSGGFNFDGNRTNVSFAGSFSDASPLLARERDIVKRGRQHIRLNNPAFFSGPPLGYTTNICSASAGGCSIVPLVLDNGTPLNSPITFVPLGYVGMASDGGAAFVTNAGQYNFELANTAQSGGGGGQALLNSPKTYSAMGTIRREFSPRIHAFFELGTSKNEGSFILNQLNASGVIAADAANNPFQQAIRVTAPAVGGDSRIESLYESSRLVGGVIIRLSEGWQAGLDFTWNRARFSSVQPGSDSLGQIQTAISTGSIDVLRDLNVSPVDFGSFLPLTQSPAASLLKGAELRLAGPLPWLLPGGSPIMSALVEYRDESFDEFLASIQGLQILTPSRSQSVNSVYVELRAPLVAAQNQVAGIKRLELQLAARRDEYRVNGATGLVLLDFPTPIRRFANEDSSVDPTIGLRYQPVSDLMFRASYGTGYRPPSVTQLVPNAVEFTFTPALTDPRRGNEPLGPITSPGGGNPNLEPEISDSWSAGFVLTPEWMPGFRVSADWSKISKTDNIAPRSRGVQSDLDNEAFISGLITRGPVPEGEDPNLYGVGPITSISTALINLSRLTVEAVDLAVSHQTDLERFGSIDVAVGATRLISLETQVSPTAPIVENLGAANAFANDEGGAGGGLKWKANGSVTWQYGNWALGWVTRFFDSYFLNTDHSIVPNQGAATIPSQIYHDLTGSYRFPNASGNFSGLLSDLDVRFGVTNVFNKAPPVDVDAGFGRLYYSPWGDPRLASYSISVSKNFGGNR